MTSPEFFSIRDLSDPRVQIQWHEAVAVVAGIATWAADLGVEYLPDLDALGLSANGQPVADPGAADGDQAVRQLGRALQLLLNDDAPDRLAELAALATRAHEKESVDKLESALRFYERPDRPAQLRALTARASSLERENEPPARAEFEHWQEQARARASVGEPTAAAPSTTRHEKSRRRWVGAIAVATCAAAVATAVRVPVYHEAMVAPLLRFLTPAAVHPEAGPEKPQGTGDERHAPARTPQSKVGRSTLPMVTHQPARPSAAPSGVAGSEPRETLVTTITEDPRDARPARVDPTQIYTAAVAGITPPTPVRQHLPSAPPRGRAAEEMGVLALTIDSNGMVERVQLVSPSSRFEDRMLVAAAKTWKFRPALLDGIPVRYRLEVRVTR